MMTRQQYFAAFKQAALTTAKNYKGLFPSVILAQASLEGGDGNSTLAAVYNNHFGIKADKSWKGKVVRLKTREVFNGNEVYIVDGFRVYDKAEDSFRDRAEFLKQFSRYKKVWTAPTPFDQARELQAAGYATDPNYAVTINSIIRMNKLEAIDNELKKNATS